MNRATVERVRTDVLVLEAQLEAMEEHGASEESIACTRARLLLVQYRLASLEDRLRG